MVMDKGKTLREYQARYMKRRVPIFHVGDTVEVHYRIREKDKERVQRFQGTVIRRSGGGTAETFTVRRIVDGEGVERVFPLHSPNLVDIKVLQFGRVRRARLYYLRERLGKATRVKERILSKEQLKELAKGKEFEEVARLQEEAKSKETAPKEEEEKTKENEGEKTE